MAYFNFINIACPATRAENGRVYDTQAGAFLCPDPFVQEPHNPSNYNRYSYVLNNPLKYTDPSGYQKTWRKPFPMRHWWDYSDVLRHYGNGGGGGGMPTGGYTSSPLTGHNYAGSTTAGYKYDPITETYRDRFNYQEVDPDVALDWLYSKTPDKGKDSYAIYQSVNYVDGEKFLTGSYGIIKEGTMVSTGIFPVFSSRNDAYDYIYGLTRDIAQSQGDGIKGIPKSDAVSTLAGASAIPVNTIKGGFDAARVTQKTVSTWSKGARVLSRTSNILTAATVSYDFSTGTANTSTLVNAGVAVVGAGVVFAVGIAAAPWVAAGGVVYGIVSLAGGDDWLNSQWDISDKINFVNPSGQ